MSRFVQLLEALLLANHVNPIRDNGRQRCFYIMRSHYALREVITMRVRMNSLHYLHSHGVSNSPRAIAHPLVVLLVVISGSSLERIESRNVVPFGSRRQVGPILLFQNKRVL